MRRPRNATAPGPDRPAAAAAVMKWPAAAREGSDGTFKGERSGVSRPILSSSGSLRTSARLGERSRVSGPMVAVSARPRPWASIEVLVIRIERRHGDHDGPHAPFAHQPVSRAGLNRDDGSRLDGHRLAFQLHPPGPFEDVVDLGRLAVVMPDGVADLGDVERAPEPVGRRHNPGALPARARDGRGVFGPADAVAGTTGRGGHRDKSPVDSYSAYTRSGGG